VSGQVIPIDCMERLRLAEEWVRWLAHQFAVAIDEDDYLTAPGLPTEIHIDDPAEADAFRRIIRPAPEVVA
jgi:hypothetical protein